MTDIVALEIYFWDGAQTQTLRLSNVGQVSSLASRSEAYQYEPGLYVPLLLGPQISAENYGQADRGQIQGNAISFAVSPGVWPYLAYNWVGRPFRAYTGTKNRALTQVFSGRIGGLTFDTGSPKGSFTATDASIALDGPLVSDLYDTTALPAIQGRPKPRLWGQGYSLQPVLEDENSQIYRISTAALDDILDVRVGGVSWDRVSGKPEQGQWSADLANGRFQLGSPTLSLDVRCDARAVGWQSLTTAALMQQIIESAGFSVDAATMAQFAVDAPHLVGFYATDAINRLDALDQISAGIGGWWSFGPLGTLIAGVIAAPASTPDLSLSEVDVLSLQLTQMLPPAWRVRVEWQRNWQPASNFAQALSEAEQQAQSAPGIALTAYENDTLKANEPLALDVPLINSLVVTEADAQAIGTRLATAWSVMRRLFTVSTTDETTPSLYGTVGVSFEMVDGNFRVHAPLKGLGGRPSQLVVWG